MHLCSSAPLSLPTRESKHYKASGTNQGTIIGPVVLPDPKDEWRATFAEKKKIYGKCRRPVGGKTSEQRTEESGTAAQKARLDTDMEVVFMNAMSP